MLYGNRMKSKYHMMCVMRGDENERG
jgi:hypothetical protein